MNVYGSFYSSSLFGIIGFWLHWPAIYTPSVFLLVWSKLKLDRLRLIWASPAICCFVFPRLIVSGETIHIMGSRILSLWFLFFTKYQKAATPNIILVISSWLASSFSQEIRKLYILSPPFSDCTVPPDSTRKCTLQ